MKRWLSLCLFACVLSISSAAQQYDLQTNRDEVVSLASSKWHFHPGDDPQWAQPEFDDSSWPLLKADAPWSGQGYSGLSGFGWYRFKIAAPTGAPKLALRLPNFGTDYEVFADGISIGGCGHMNPEPQPTRCVPQVFDLPAVQSGHPITIAIRVWHWFAWANYFGGGPTGAGAFGASDIIHKQFSDSRKISRLSVMPFWILSLLYGLGAVSALLLFLLRRSEKEYLWFGLMVLAESLEFAWSVWQWSHQIPVRTGELVDITLNFLTWLAALVFFAELLHAKRTVFFWVSVATAVCLPLVTVLFYAVPWLEHHVAVTNMASSFLLLFPSSFIVFLLVKRSRERFSDAVLLLVPAIILYGSGLVGSVLHIFGQLGVDTPILENVRLVTTPFPIDIPDTADFVFLIGMLAILINRFTRTRRVEERYASEFESARHVQEVLVPVHLGSTPGFVVEAEYCPARIVGGDFYQVLPGNDGALLIVVGDVAGKGMPAAMLVAMIVGAIRTQAVFSMDPSTMLHSLNERLCGHSSGGFSTCLVAFIRADGEMTIANAGHLSPYLNGKEHPVAANLPLGLEPGVEYESETFALTPGDRLTFVSDGIVEATNAKRQLFGFERTEAISDQSAMEIIQAAQAFGQDDDITVVTAAFGT